MALSVIVGVDGPEDSTAAVDWAADEARRRGVALNLVHAWSWSPRQAPALLEIELARLSAEDALGRLAARAAERDPGLSVSTTVAEQPVREALVELGEGAPLLVVGKRGTGGFPGLLVGSTSLSVAARASCPVVVVPDGSVPPGPGGRVVAGIDGREPGEAILAFAFDAARREQLPLLVAHAFSYPLITGPGHELPPVYEEGHIEAEASRTVAEILAGWREKYPEVAVVQEVARSGAAKHLLEWSVGARLLVVGRHGRPHSALGRLGSVSQAVVHHAQCPVAVVPMD
ncbi:universal stress protein [Streptacidiphilus albus]|uniref:universal stress protein n=1 Tax=Streptacidiphilus albus TaxID=105425 RepID=UPI00054BF140|nr:universal stress protein [Streptacidiphilus albus]